MNEATLKRALMVQLRAAMPGAVLWRIEDKFSGGRPDILIVWQGRVACVEVKMDRPGRKGKREPLQALTLQRLENAGARAFWLTYHPRGATLERPDKAVAWSIERLAPGRAPHREVARTLANMLDPTL